MLDNILRLSMGRLEKSRYGSNPDYDDDFGSREFVFPMPGTPCTRERARAGMSELAATLRIVP